jgi:GNAT superfamily N-acetyltransferase
VQTRPATPADAAEVVRLARIMFESMGVVASAEEWAREGARKVRQWLGHDLAVLVVDHPSEPGRLVASGAGVVTRRLPGPGNPSGLVGYVQWVCVDEAFRRNGLARQVMGGLLAWFDGRGVGAVELHATPAAEGLYRSLGFDESGGRALRRRRGPSVPGEPQR